MRARIFLHGSKYQQSMNRQHNKNAWARSIWQHGRAGRGFRGRALGGPLTMRTAKFYIAAYISKA